MVSFRSRKSQNTLFWPILLKNKKRTKYPIFGREPWTYPFGKMQNFRVFKSMLFSLKWLVFHLQGHKTLCFGLFFLKNKTGQNIQFLTKNHGLTPLEKWQIFVFFKWMFFEFKMASLLSRSSQNTCLVFFCWKTKKDKISNFLPTTM